MTAGLPLIPTHVMGSHGFPGWFWTALDKIKADEYGQTDVKETFDDATQLAIRDQERAGIDIVCDGEMRRFFFVQTFYGRMDVKSFYMETAEDVAERLALCARFIPIERLSAVPDCGFFPVPRWVAFEKLKRLVAGTQLARRNLGVA